MLLVAQRVRTPSGAMGVNVSAYAHGSHASSALARAPQLGFVESALRPALMLTVKDVQGAGARVVSFLDVVFPDELPSDAAAALVERAVLSSPAGQSVATWSDGPVAVRFYAGPEADSSSELRDLRAAMRPVFGQVVSEPREPPAQVSPPRPVHIERSRGQHGDRYRLDPSDRERLSKSLGRALPAAFSIADDTREAFESFALAKVERILVEALTGTPFDALRAEGGAVIQDSATGRTIWSSQ